MRHRGTATGAEIAQHIGLPFPVTEKVLHALRQERLLVVRNAAALTDYLYEITDFGLQRGAAIVRCNAVIAAPCPSRWTTIRPAYWLSRWTARGPRDAFRLALGDLTVSDEMIARLGRAVTSGWGLFLHGYRRATAKRASPSV